MKRATVVASFLAAFLPVAAASTAGAQGVSAIRVKVYSAKFLCGEVRPDPGPGREAPVKPGNYRTAINVRNPSDQPVNFRKKGVLLYDETNPDSKFEVPKPPAKPVGATLPADWGLEIDCPDIRRVLLGGVAPDEPAFIKGWVVLETPFHQPLDVVAAYTAHGFAPDTDGNLLPEGFSLEIVPVSPTETTRAPGQARPRPRCGNGTLEAAEECDPPGSACADGQSCEAGCTCPQPCDEPCAADPPFCVDGTLHTPGAQCVDGNCLQFVSITPCIDGASTCTDNGDGTFLLTTFEPACNEAGTACGPPEPTVTTCAPNPPLPNCTATCDPFLEACFTACAQPPR